MSSTPFPKLSTPKKNNYFCSEAITFLRVGSCDMNFDTQNKMVIFKGHFHVFWSRVKSNQCCTIEMITVLDFTLVNSSSFLLELVYLSLMHETRILSSVWNRFKNKHNASLVFFFFCLDDKNTNLFSTYRWMDILKCVICFNILIFFCSKVVVILVLIGWPMKALCLVGVRNL